MALRHPGVTDWQRNAEVQRENDDDGLGLLALVAGIN
jgi:hypothetical protein